jgi:hypothetical protein
MGSKRAVGEEGGRFGAEAIVSRVRKNRRLIPQAVRWVLEAEKLEEEPPGPAQLTRQQRRALVRRAKRLEARKLLLLAEDHEFVGEVLSQKGPLSGVCGAGIARDADELLWFVCEELELLPLLAKLRPAVVRDDARHGKQVGRRTLYAPRILNLLSLISRHQGLHGGPEIQAALLADTHWMRLLGFNLQEVKEGACRRGEALLGKTRAGGGGKFVEAGEAGPVRAKLEGRRGALSCQTLSGHESALPPAKVAALFNGVVRRLAEQGYFPEQIRAALDSTNAEVVPSFPGAGVARRKVKVRSRARRPKQMEVRLYGFKFWFLMDVETGLPLSLMMDTIEQPECEHARQLVDQALKNVAGHARLVSLAVDRGFLDGDFLWWLKEKRGIDWVCPAKEKMGVTEEARTRVREALRQARQRVTGATGPREEEELETARRLARHLESSEGVHFQERVVRAGADTLVVAEVEDLTMTEFYGPGGSGSSRLNSKKYLPTPLHATVVLNWPDRPARDREDAASPTDDGSPKGPVVLLSPVSEPGFVRFDRYDARSLIENRLNRDGKQFFQLGQALARNANALWSATVFSTLALALHRALRIHEERALAAFERRREELGVLRYRRQMAMRSTDKIIVIVQGCYARIDVTDFALLAGFRFT